MSAHLRRSPVLLILLSASAVLSGCGDDGAAPSDAGSADAGGVDATVGDAGLDDPYAPPPPVPPLPEPVLDGLRMDVDAALDGVPGATWSALMVDADSGQVLYQRSPSTPMIPASNTKLLTTAAAMELLGEDHRASLAVFGDGSLDGSGVLGGDLHLVGEHEVTLSTLFQDAATFPLAQLADDLFAAGLRRVEGRIVVHGEMVYDGDRFGTYDPVTEREEAAAAFASELATRGVTAAGTATVAAFDPPAGATALAAYRSRPLSLTCLRTNDLSHNELADALSRHLGWELAGTSSYEAGAREVLGWLASTGLDATGVALHDGSGLSYDNRVSARELVGLIRFVLGTPVGETWRRTLAVAGVPPGTLQSRLRGDDTWGRVFGKTGTLNPAIALSGLLLNRHDGRRYVFSLLANGLDASRHGAARAAVDRIVERLAVDHVENGARPPAPILRSVVNDGTGSSVTVRWEPSPGAEGHLIWISRDGRVWDRARARLVVDGDVHRIGRLAASETLFLRVTAVSPAGESDPSDVYAARVAASPSSVLLVDGNDRWQAEPARENTLGVGHDSLARLAAALEAVGGGALAFDSTANEEVERGDVPLDRYVTTMWLLGEESTAHEALSGEEQARISTYLDAGGSLFLSGAELGYDLVETGSGDDASFFRSGLHADYVADGAGTFLVRGGGGAFADLPLMGFLSPRGVLADFPDVLSPAGGSEAVLRYVGGSGGVAGLAYDGDAKIVLLGFPFEGLESTEDRELLMAAVLAFLAS